MKKSLSLCLVLVLLLCSVLASCTGNSDLPDGMQLCRDSDALGYTMYAPDGWTVSNVGSISCCYVSSINQVSISLTEADDGGITDFQAYFDAHKDEFPYEISMQWENTEVTLGNAARAASFGYTFTYQNTEFKSMQILATYGERFYIFTYTAYTRVYENDTSYYDHYISFAKQVMDTLVFRAKATEPAPEYTADADGYLLVSDRTVNGFLFYMAPAFSCEIKEGLVAARTADGASVNLAEATGTGMYGSDYFDDRLSELSVFVDDQNGDGKRDAADITVLLRDEPSDAFSDLSASRVRAYEYTFSHGGVVYHVYQFLAIENNRGYVYTYTAPADVYDEHIEEAMTMASKVRFS